MASFIWTAWSKWRFLASSFVFEFFNRLPQDSSNGSLIKNVIKNVINFNAFHDVYAPLSQVIASSITYVHIHAMQKHV